MFDISNETPIITVFDDFCPDGDKNSESHKTEAEYAAFS